MTQPAPFNFIVAKDAKTITVERAFAAMLDTVWAAWTKADILCNWWAPKPYQCVITALDFRAGGQWHFKMTGPNGEEGWSLARYEEIQAPERIVYVDSFSDADRNIVPPESRVTVEFVDRGPKKTLLRMQSVYASNDARDQVIAMGVEQGVGISFDQLEAYLATQQ